MSRSPRIMGDTRREREAKVRRTFGPLYELAGQLRADAVDAIKGEPVLMAWGQYMSAAHTLEGFGRCFERIAPGIDFDVFAKLSKRLKNGVPIEREDVDSLILSLRKAEGVYRVTPLKDLTSAINTQMIADELEELAEKGIAA